MGTVQVHVRRGTSQVSWLWFDGSRHVAAHRVVIRMSSLIFINLSWALVVKLYRLSILPKLKLKAIIIWVNWSVQYYVSLYIEVYIIIIMWALDTDIFLLIEPSMLYIYLYIYIYIYIYKYLLLFPLADCWTLEVYMTSLMALWAVAAVAVCM